MMEHIRERASGVERSNVVNGRRSSTAGDPGNQQRMACDGDGNPVDAMEWANYLNEEASSLDNNVPTLSATNLCTFTASMLGSTVDVEDDVPNSDEHDKNQTSAEAKRNRESNVRTGTVPKGRRVHPIDEEIGHQNSTKDHGSAGLNRSSETFQKEATNNVAFGRSSTSSSRIDYSANNSSHGINWHKWTRNESSTVEANNENRPLSAKNALQVVAFVASLGLMIITMRQWNNLSTPEQLIFWSFANNLMMLSILLIFV